MSVNLRFGIDPDKTRHLGNLFGSIDFEVSSTSKGLLESRGENATAGKFLIGGKEFQVTLAELDRIVETCQTAKSVFFQKYRFGK